jgi:hypothetical protein
MNTTELKKTLLFQIGQIEDLNLLKSIEIMIEEKNEEKIMMLSDAQKESIYAARKDYKKGLFLDDAAFQIEIEKCLKEE